jgi:hypothetical protein
VSNDSKIGGRAAVARALDERQAPVLVVSRLV